MNDEIDYKNNPLHGLTLKNLLIELVDHYGFEILFAYLNINCFKTNPSIESSIKFLKKTDWAREKVEAFYLYQFKGLPRASSSQFELPPRDRIIPSDQQPGEPAELSLEDAARLQEKRAQKAAKFGKAPTGGNSSPQRRNAYSRSAAGDKTSSRSDSNRARKPSTPSSSGDRVDPWAKWKK